MDAVIDAPVVADGLTLPDNWKDMIPEDIRKEPVIEQTKDITSMAKRLVESQKMIGSRIKLPVEGDTSGWDDVYNKLGRPEKADDYKIARPENVPYDESLEKEFKTIAHKTGLNNSQVQALVNWNLEQATAQAQTNAQQAVEAAQSLQKEWGTAFKERIAIAERVIGQFGDDATEAAIKDNPALIKLIYNLGKNMVEGQTIGGGGGTGGLMSPQEALAAITAKMRDKDFMAAYMSRKNPTHNQAVEEMKLLNEMAYPSV